MTRIRIVNPSHQLYDPWFAPFFFEDSRHVFFVTTMDKQVFFPDYSGYPLVINPDMGFLEKLPDLVFKTDPSKEVGPKFWGDGGPVGPDLSVNSPVPMQRFVTDDAYIHKGIGTTGSVMYGDRQIGPSGAIADDRAKTN